MQHTCMQYTTNLCSESLNQSSHENENFKKTVAALHQLSDVLSALPVQQPLMKLSLSLPNMFLLCLSAKSGR